MKILFVSPSYKPAWIYGGPAVSVSELAEALVATGHSVTIYTTTANGKEELAVETNVPVVVNGVNVYYFKRQTGDHTHVSLSLWMKLWSTSSNFDVINFQSWWSLLILGAAAICSFKKKNYIVSPRGMMSIYSFERKKSVPKKIIHHLLGKHLLRRSYLHATTELEWKDCQKVIPGWEGYILPNIVRFPSELRFENQQKEINPILTFGFLSRIDPKKGLELVFEALSPLRFDYRLKIAGKGEEGYVNSLKKLAKSLAIDDKIDWYGWTSGDEKFYFLQSVDVFVLTSYNENFANSVVESLAMGTPVLLSKGVGLANYVENNGFGWVAETNVPSIRTNIQRIYSERGSLAAIQKRAPAIIKKEFNKTNLAYQYLNAYEQFT